MSGPGRPPRPGDFPLGSARSRAAARALLEWRNAGVSHLQIVNDIPDASPSVSVGPWLPRADGGLVRIINVPCDADEEAIERLLATP